MNEGWIKLHRQLFNHARSGDPDWVALWVRLLSMATHQSKETVFNGKVIKLLPGQLITGRKILAQLTGITESKIQRLLSCYESEQQIEQQTAFHSRLITVKNWNQYQQSEQQIEQQMNSKRTASEQPMNTIQEDKELKKERISTNVDDKSNRPRPDKRDPRIDELMGSFKALFGLSDFKESQQWQRIYAKHLVSLTVKLGQAEFMRRVDVFAADSFKMKNCNSLKYLYEQIKSTPDHTVARVAPRSGIKTF